MSSTRPDALQTVADQLEFLCREWEHAAKHNPNLDGDPANPPGDPRYGDGQNDAWRHCARQVRQMVKSIRATRRDKGLYASDDWHAVVEMIRSSQANTQQFLRSISRQLADIDSNTRSPFGQDGPPSGAEFRRPEGMTEDEEWDTFG